MTDEILEDVRRQDAVLRARGLDIWIGAEPTFTRRESQEPWWLTEAEGGDKEEHARALLRALALRLPQPARLLKVMGRHFPDEPKPRFCLGAQWHRDPRRSGTPLPAGGLDGEPAAVPKPDPELAWLTVTPDPGVVEVNMAPAPDLETFLDWSRDVYAAAADAGLSPVRYRWNGEAVDSGGGGQITLGGPSPEASPFFRHPHLLPGFLRYLNRHPSLSYWFATECVGSSSQGPRPDEGVRERFEELTTALFGLGRAGAPSPADLWRALAPLLVDCSGNSHRAELNVEKLWNPYLPVRGCQGLVELRSFRMESAPERMAAVGALLRALAARLVASPYEEPLVDWSSALHDRFALPAVLEDDLRDVLSDLEAHGVGLGAALVRHILDPPAPIGRLAQGEATLVLTPALEYWPLVGDVASEERRGARLLDASTQRLQVMIEAPAGEEPGQVSVDGWTLPLVSLPSRGKGCWVAGVRYRDFVPEPGLHPRLPAHGPLSLTWVRGARAAEIVLHGWIPGGGSYPGLPADAAEASRRREERVIIRSASPEAAAAAAPPAGARSTFTLDLRRCAPW
jgi:uncharacterized protein (DUF2126 family)